MLAVTDVTGHSKHGSDYAGLHKYYTLQISTYPTAYGVGCRNLQYKVWVGERGGGGGGITYSIYTK